MVAFLTYLAILVIPLFYVVLSSRFPTLRLSLLLKPSSTRTEQAPAEKDPKKQLKTIMQAAREDLAQPGDKAFTTEDLKEFDGSDETKPVYVAVKGIVFDVSRKRDVYGKGKPYNVFAGKDGSKGLGMSSLKGEDAVGDYSGLSEKELNVLKDWFTFFEGRYNIVGEVKDNPVTNTDDQLPIDN